jgi:hypothetical protein
VLIVNSFVGAPAIAQQDEAAALDKRIGELYRAGSWREIGVGNGTVQRVKAELG